MYLILLYFLISKRFKLIDIHPYEYKNSFRYSVYSNTIIVINNRKYTFMPFNY